jgi:hypothetical protein
MPLGRGLPERRGSRRAAALEGRRAEAGCRQSVAIADRTGAPCANPERRATILIIAFAPGATARGDGDQRRR